MSRDRVLRRLHINGIVRVIDPVRPKLFTKFLCLCVHICRSDIGLFSAECSL